MLKYINNLIEDKRPSRRTLAFGISFAAAALILAKTTLLSKLKESIMGSKASCCQCNTQQNLSSEINFDNMPLKKNKKNPSSQEEEQFVFVQSTGSKNPSTAIGESQQASRSILKRHSAYNIEPNIASVQLQDKSKSKQAKDQDIQQNLTNNQTSLNSHIQSNYLQLATKIQEVPKIDDSIKVETRGPLHIIYGTTGGNSGRLAANLIAEARQQNYSPKLVHLGDFDPIQFTKMERAIFVISTYGTGGPTQDASFFFDWISKQDNVQLFSHLKYLVFGLGNSTFENFAGFGVKIDAKLEQLGAKRVYQFGKGNAAEDTTDQDFNLWKENLWNVLNQQFTLYETTLKELRESEAGFELKIQEKGVQEIDFDNYVFQDDKIESRLKEYFSATNAPIKEIRELRQKPQESSCLHIDFDLSSTSMTYDTAGNLGVYPENDPKSVQNFAALHGYNLEDIFTLESSQERQKLPLPTPMKIKTFLTKFCDIFGPVNKIILQGLAALSNNAEFQSQCDVWVNDSSSFEENIRQKNHSIFSLSKQFQIRIPLLNLIELSNRMFPRFYTISSSNLKHPKNIHMCISISSITDPSEKRQGQASSFFSSLKQNYANQRVRIFHQQSLFKLPEDKSVPIIMIGPGAGLAPFRAFLQEKRFLEENKQNNKFGECQLYFGCRGKNVDYIYQKDLEQFQKQNVCNYLRLAFSRDGPNKVYVQDLLSQDIDQIAELFLQQQATIYVCGSKSVGEAVKDFIISMYQEKEGLVPYLAYSKISELESDKRLIMEVWG